MKLFAGLEADSLAGRDGDLGASARVPADARFAGLHCKDAETTQLDTIPFAQSRLHCLENHIDGGLCLGARETGTLDNSLNQILLDHGAYTTLPRARPGQTFPPLRLCLSSMVERGISVVNVSAHQYTALYDRLNATTSSELRLALRIFPWDARGA